MSLATTANAEQSATERRGARPDRRTDMDTTTEILAEKFARLGAVTAKAIEESVPVAQLKAASEVVARLRPPYWSA